MCVFFYTLCGEKQRNANPQKKEKKKRLTRGCGMWVWVCVFVSGVGGWVSLGVFQLLELR